MLLHTGRTNAVTEVGIGVFFNIDFDLVPIPLVVADLLAE
jgi:phage shock protein PspC (stress-responsive transcriptional regulator)